MHGGSLQMAHARRRGGAVRGMRQARAHSGAAGGEGAVKGGRPAPITRSRSPDRARAVRHATAVCARAAAVAQLGALQRPEDEPRGWHLRRMAPLFRSPAARLGCVAPALAPARAWVWGTWRVGSRMRVQTTTLGSGGRCRELRRGWQQSVSVRVGPCHPASARVSPCHFMRARALLVNETPPCTYSRLRVSGHAAVSTCVGWARLSRCAVGTPLLLPLAYVTLASVCSPLRAHLRLFDSACSILSV